MATNQMTSAERSATGALAGIFGLRMLGLFLILPVFTLYGEDLTGATPTLIGLAIGAYGLTQAMLQIPGGFLSDRFGRRPVILAGLVLFAGGSVLAALSGSIYGVIAGRALQGSGAISAAVLALAADNTRPEQRTKTMAFIGISVGVAFLTALITGPLIAGQVGLSGIFWLTALLAVVCVGLLYVVVPSGGERPQPSAPGSYRAQLRQVLADRDLLRLDFGIMVLHLVLTASFVAFPIVLRDDMGIAGADHWQVYVPVLLLSVLAMGPVVMVGERRRMMHRVLVAVVLVLVIADLTLATTLHVTPLLLLALWLFFAAFNILEATLPSLVSRFAASEARGTALGVYSTCQFLGAFMGGVLGGWLLGTVGPSGVFMACAGLGALWFLLALGLRSPERRVATASGVGQ